MITLADTPRRTRLLRGLWLETVSGHHFQFGLDVFPTLPLKDTDTGSGCSPGAELHAEVQEFMPVGDN